MLKKYTTIGFNSNHYDLPLLGIALSENSTCEMIKEASDKIIIGNLKWWDIEREYRVGRPVCDHIDLIEVAPGIAGLKIYGGRLHCQKMQDLPIDPSASIAEADRTTIRTYCGNDLEVTEALYRKLEPAIALRIKMGREYGLDLRSKSDAQIAEAVITQSVSLKLKTKLDRPRIPSGTTYHYAPPPWMSFHHAELRQLLADVLTAEFTIKSNGQVKEPAVLDKRTVRLGNSVYRLGIGGLHSSEEHIAHIADDEHVLIDRDVESYYPNIILRLGLAPEQMGTAFLDVYADILARRLDAKYRGDKVTNDALKICVNGSYGKLGSMWSALYSPNLMIQVTVTGQLALLMLIESLEQVGIPVVSANTDGVVIHCPKAMVGECDYLVWEWEQVTGFKTEETRYRALYSESVNSYIALKEKGGAKLKGPYAQGGLAKNPVNQICVDAVLAWLDNGTPLMSTIRECRDITKFITVRKVAGGAEKDGQYLGRAVRWYQVIHCPGPITYKTNGNAVSKSEGGRPLMELPATFPNDVDYVWYEREAMTILQRIGALREEVPA
jgi:hypothetical protein